MAIARAVGAELRIVEILDIQWAGTPAIIPGSGAELAAHQPAARARASLDEVVASFPGDVHVETAVVLGHPVGDLVRQSEDADLLVLGSRGYGPRRAVLLGGVSGRVVRKSACPVIVVPRGIERPLEDLFPPASLMEPDPPRDLRPPMHRAPSAPARAPVPRLRDQASADARFASRSSG